MTDKISKRKLKKYLEELQEELKLKQRQIIIHQKARDENKITDYDLQEDYLRESEVKGAIKAVYHILNNFK